MGVLNVTPDSFSDGGRFLDPDPAVAHGSALHAAGADLVDVGGESTRPGADRVDADEELRRVLPVVRDLAADGVPVSIDTTRAEVAEAALEAGADDRQRRERRAGRPGDGPGRRGGRRAVDPHALARPQRPDAVAGRLRRRGRRGARRAGGAGGRRGAGRRRPGPDRARPRPGVRQDGRAQLGAAGAAGRLLALGFPVLVGASRKRFLGELLAGADGAPRPPDGREDATAAITALAGRGGRLGGPGARRRVVHGRGGGRGGDAAGRGPGPGPATAPSRERPDRAARPAGARPPRGLRARAPRRAGLRRRRHRLAGPRPRRRVRTTSPTPSTTASSRSAPPRSSPARRST